MLNLISIGSTVKLSVGDIEGVVTGIQITNNLRVLYSVVWWNGRTREEKWLDTFEVVSVTKSLVTKIGFVNAEPK